ncbi:MAG TPA: hypothetical protein DCS28_02710 [Candidatus Moranbacteria bacterium]|nr:hypothetical protein [Candidatus Moranbacteria bacterium]HAT74927.1 hypothetical protein [Candidatus Moranbacteria bacterium]
MFDFIFRKNTFLGVDIGTASIKIVELKVIEGRPILSNYAWMPLSEDILEKGINSDYAYALLPQYIKRIIKKAGFGTRNAFVSLPAFGGLITLIDFPEMAEQDMEQAIKFEAHKYIPTSLDEVVISWEVVEKKSAKIASKDTVVDKSDTTLKVLLVAASKNKVLKYENLIEAAGLKLKSVDIEAFSAVRSLVGNDSGCFIIIDIGSKACNIILVEKGIIRINRNIDAGGMDLTKTISKGMVIDFERAEALKISGTNFFDSKSSVSFFTMELLTGEVERIVRTYLRDGEKKAIDEIILSGGTANMVGLAEYFSNKLKIKTVIGNPLAKISYDSKLEKAVSKIRTGFSVAIGLTLKGVDEYLKKEAKIIKK